MPNSLNQCGMPLSVSHKKLPLRPWLHRVRHGWAQMAMVNTGTIVSAHSPMEALNYTLISADHDQSSAHTAQIVLNEDKDLLSKMKPPRQRPQTTAQRLIAQGMGVKSSTVGSNELRKQESAAGPCSGPHWSSRHFVRR
ncbi:hypothetical protein ACS0TY_032548 [Phlomoides rotata]